MAAKTIKGITVKIGGDVTGLGKALKTVETSARDLEGNLKKVNKALELDPSNTELVAEKQKVLASYVDATREKLETLESVQDQIKQQYADGEIGQSAYLDFQKELILTKNKLEDLERQQKEFAAAAESAANDELKDVSEALEDVQEAADGTGDGFTVAKGAMADFISDTVQSGIEKIKDLTGELFELSEATEEYRIMQAKLAGSADTFGYSLEFAGGQYQNFYRYLADDQAATNAITNLMGLHTSTQSLSNLAQGAISVWTAYGDSIPIETLTESINETAQVGKVTGVLADALNWAGISEDFFNEQLTNCLNTQERANYIAAILNDTYGESKERYDAMNASILDANEAEQALADTQATLGEAMQPVNTLLTELKTEILIALTPLIVELANGFVDLLGWLKEHPAVLYTVIGAVTALSIAFGVLAAAMAIQSIISAVSAGFAGLSGIMTALPVVAVVGLIGVIVACIGWLIDNLDSLKIMWKESWDSILSNFKKGNMAVVTETHAMHVAAVTDVQEMSEAMKTSFADAHEAAFNETHAMNIAAVANVQEMGANMKASWSATWSSVVSYFKSGNKAVATETHAMNIAAVANTQQMASSFRTALSGMWSNAKSCFSSILSSASSWGSNMLSSGRSAVENLRSAISSGLERVKSLFRFDWSLPRIRLPHFNISGSFSLNPPRVPKFSVQWYQKGGILQGAQLFGSLGGKLLGGGEAGPEAVLPLSDFYSELNRILTGFLSSHTMPSGDTSAILKALNGIYERLDRLQVVMDSGALVGELIDPLDAGFAQRQLLAERGV